MPENGEEASKPVDQKLTAIVVGVVVGALILGPLMACALVTLVRRLRFRRRREAGGNAAAVENTHQNVKPRVPTWPILRNKIPRVQIDVPRILVSRATSLRGHGWFSRFFKTNSAIPMNSSH